MVQPISSQSGCQFFNPIRTGVFDGRVSRGGGRGEGGMCFSRLSPVCYFVCKPRVMKFGTQDAQILVTDKPKIRPFSVLARILVRLS